MHHSPMVQKVLILAAIFIAIFVRLYNLSWGLPFPFHPDERNMADAIVRLECPTPVAKECFNPHFYAYGQAPLYIGYVGIQALHAITGEPQMISFDEAVMTLRIQSVFYSLGILVFALGIVQFIIPLSAVVIALCLIFLSLQPYIIQFAHFGTTESLLMMLYMSIIWLTCHIYKKPNIKMISVAAFMLGISVGVKISSLVFGLLPATLLIFAVMQSHEKMHRKVQLIARYGLVGFFMLILGAFIVSPHYFINWIELLGSMYYEVGVGNGSIPVFYTRQFEYTIPYLFQFVKVFPYTHGFLGLAIFLASFLFYSWNNPYFNILRLSFILYFVPSGFLFTKWARFMAPIMPVMSLIAFVWIVFLISRVSKNIGIRFVVAILLIVSLLPGIGYLAVYGSMDVRYQASEWMNAHIKSHENVLIESGNVVDLPIHDPKNTQYAPYTGYKRAIVDLYNADIDPAIQIKLDKLTRDSDYVIIASRRVFANHTCEWPDQSSIEMLFYRRNPIAAGRYAGWCEKKMQDYPRVQRFFDDVFDTEKYYLVQTFTSYPRIQLWDKTLIQFPDENAEEAWTVFDHPTIRIYKKLQPQD